MADEQRVSQAGVTVAAEIENVEQVSQAGVTVAAELVSSLQQIQVSQAGVTVAACAILPPEITDLAVALNEAQEVVLTWTNGTDESVDIVIERSVDGGAYTTLATLTDGEETYTDTDTLGLGETRVYRFQVVAGLCLSGYTTINVTAAVVYSHGTEFGNGGAATVIPSRGDRSAWRVTDYGADHADDIAAGALTRHLPAPAAAGSYARDNGTVWVSQIGVPITDLNSYTRGSIIRGGAATWEALDAKSARKVLIGDGTDVVSRVLEAADLPSGGYGSGTAGRVAQWAAGGVTLENSTLIKSGAGVLTLSAAGAYTLTVPETGTAALSTGIADGQTIYGGTAANDDLTLSGTSHATKTTSYVNIQPTGGKVRIGSVPNVTTALVSLVGASGSAQIYLNNSAQGNGGGILGSSSDTAIVLAGGANYTSQYIALAAYASMMAFYNGQIYFRTDSGLTAGNAFTPTNRMYISTAGRVMVGGVSPSGQFHVGQSSATGAIPVLVLDQGDVSEEFVRFIGQSAADASQSFVDAADMTTPGALVGWIKVYIQDDAASGAIADGAYYVPFYAAPTA